MIAEIDRVGGVGMHHVVYPNGDTCEYLAVWFRCRAVGGRARVNDDESTEVGWFGPDDLPEIDELTRLRIETTVAEEAPAWYVPAGVQHPAFDRRR